MIKPVLADAEITCAFARCSRRNFVASHELTEVVEEKLGFRD